MVEAQAGDQQTIPGYCVLERIGSGGMADVFLARALDTAELVAIKVLRTALGGTDAEQRFHREIVALRELRHPRIVRYVDHGLTGEGRPYLVMERLEGIDLQEALRRRRLTLAETFSLGIQLADCLAAAHDRGVVHRDVKPANVFLIDGQVADVRVLDFGVARLDEGQGVTLTSPGGLVGTPGYMSPEQAKGAERADPQSDLFSLGSLLFECVSGAPAFPGEHVMAILAKVLLSEPPRLDEVVPEVPQELADLVAELLDKDPAGRPPSAEEVGRRLREIDPRPQRRRAPATLAITRDEQRFHSVIFCHGEAPAVPAGAVVEAATLIDVDRAVDSRYGELLRLADGTRLLVMTRGRAISDQVNNAARCALALREAAPGLAVAIASGRAQIRGSSVLGEILERGAALLVDAEPGAIRIDDATASLLDIGFAVEGDEGGLLLGDNGELSAEASAARRLRPALVGRRVEMATLTALADECFGEPCSQMIALVGGPGVGKSRLRLELEARLRRGYEGIVRAAARCESMSSGAPLALLARLLASLAGVTGGESAVVRRRKLRARLSRHLAGDELAQVYLYLGELLAPAEDPPPELRVARGDSGLMRERIEGAWRALLRAECAAGRVLLVVEDFHWCDRASVELLAEGLDDLADAPLLVLVLARSLDDPRLRPLDGREAVELVELGPLSRRAARRLLDEARGEELDDATIERFVDAARGNPLFLEELSRGVVGAATDRLPDTIFGLVERRLTTLSANERRVLRAASVFGELFWASGVEALVGELECGAYLRRLADEEWIVASGRSRIAGEREFSFGHALIRDAAYASLTDGDRALGHRLAGAWLEHAQSYDALVVAEHYRRGRALAEASRWYAEAADAAFSRDDFGAVLDIVDRIIDRAPAGEAAGRLHLRRAEVQAVQGMHREAGESALAALGELPVTSPRWCSALGEAALAAARLGDSAQVVALTERLASYEPTADGGGENLLGLVRAAVPLAAAGAGAAAARIFERIVEVTARVAETDPGALGPLHSARALQAVGEGAVGTVYAEMLAAARAFEAVGNVRDALELTGGAGFFGLELGLLERGEELLRETIRRSHEVGLKHLGAVARHNLGRRLAERGRVDEALELEFAALRAFAAHDNHRMHGLTLAHIAWALLLAGRVDEALAQADAAVERLHAEIASRAIALATRAQIQLRRGEAAAALRDAKLAVEGLSGLDRVQEGESLIRLTWAEALFAVDDVEAAREAIDAARRSVDERAAKIAEADLRARFSALRENARIAALARERLA
ncbi:MAG: protein kinase [Myxococcales bacterium]|nr:protein kinase [Myxococcales bacterium]